MTEAIAFTTFDQFLAAEIASPERHELVGGRVYAMSGGTDRHDLTAQALYRLLYAGARPAGCRTFIGNRLIRVSSSQSYYPDVMIVCAPRADEHYETSPSLIVEVLSPSTESIDRREKTAAYQSTPSVEAYLLVSPVFRRIELATRDGAGEWQWRALGPGDVLRTRFADIDIDALYDEIDAEAGS